VFAIAVSRALHVFPLCALVNFFRLKKRRINYKSQWMMWWVGLRGPMAFALSLDAADNFGEAGLVMKTTVLCVTVLTVYVNGGASAYLLQHLDLRKKANKEDEEVEEAVQEKAEDLEMNEVHIEVDGDDSITFLKKVRQFNSGALVDTLDKVDKVLKNSLASPPIASKKGSGLAQPSSEHGSPALPSNKDCTPEKQPPQA
jgi:NhaP-type Na+/H+ or K+/H+ antiporter